MHSASLAHRYCASGSKPAQPPAATAIAPSAMATRASAVRGRRDHECRQAPGPLALEPDGHPRGGAMGGDARLALATVGLPSSGGRSDAVVSVPYGPSVRPLDRPEVRSTLRRGARAARRGHPRRALTIAQTDRPCDDRSHGRRSRQEPSPWPDRGLAEAGPRGMRPGPGRGDVPLGAAAAGSTRQPCSAPDLRAGCGSAHSSHETRKLPSRSSGSRRTWYPSPTLAHTEPRAPRAAARSSRYSATKTGLPPATKGA